ncbi:MAG: HEAT repeat domain-containing protein [Oscillibacter sp.]|nr:HEAT repeat domain-containing protein [Oscillibacter sp.]
MSSLQPLYDVKERLEAAAVAGTGLLSEDFRLQRAAEAMKPLAAASPVFGKISAGLDRLLSAPGPDRAGLLLDTLALVDAVAYTQGRSGMEGEITPLPTGGGTYIQISHGQIQPLLTALTTTGGGRMEVIQSAWEDHPEFFRDFRVMPAVVAGLGDGYGEIADLNAKILKGVGPAALPLLKQDFDPAGNRAMARRAEVIAAIEGEAASPWLREVLPEARKDVRVAVILALGDAPDNTALLLDLIKTERSGSREAALQALARQDGDAVREFWTAELKKNSGSVRFLRDTDTEWAAALLATGLREQLEGMLAKGGPVSEEEQLELSHWCQAIGKKASAPMLELWRWADSHMEAFDVLTNEKGNSIFAGVRLTDSLRDSLRTSGPGPLRDFCLELWDRRPGMTRYLHISFLAALLARPAAEVYKKFAPCVLTKKPLLDADRKRTLNNVLLRALGDVWWNQEQGRYVVYGGQPTAEPLDRRWIERLTQAVYTDVPGRGVPPFSYYWENVNKFDLDLMKLVDPSEAETRRLLIPYLRKRIQETGLAYTYSRWLFQLGGSPRGVLGDAMVKNPKANRLSVLWELMEKAAQALPPEEVIGLLEEALASKGIYKGAQETAERAIPYTIELLKAGKPYPEWNVWWGMGK